MLIRFTMASKSYFIFVCLIILQCSLASPVDERGLSDSKPNNKKSIPLSELVSTFRGIHHDLVDVHLMFMLWVAGYGDHLYSLPVDLSADCWKTARANSLMLEKMAVVEEAFQVMGKAVDGSTRELKKSTELQEHPLELVCRRIEKEYSENTNLKPLFEKAKNDATNLQNAGHRPPYYDELIKKEELILHMVYKLDVPEMAKMMAVFSFRNLIRNFPRGFSENLIIFAKSCRAVAKNEKFADSMQNIFEKTIQDVLPEIMASNRVELYRKSPVENKKEEEAVPSWWVPNMMKILRDQHIANDSILKREVDNMVALVAKDEGDQMTFSRN